eukprot:TRINITY_DN10740_c0_g1_i1.p1 TRINITY_DN10740_c0_g1~~TRINITY_DN10740_c0_g1_i1.p1  ORF type:complete len:304 (+),score=52.78 TRINITY_DN10740_c0_g1_i1:46-957(+)
MKGVLCVVFLSLMVVGTFAYGPFSHYSFACAAYQSWDSVAINWNAITLHQGANLPDGMWDGTFASGTKCPPNANILHDPVYSGYLIKWALDAKYKGNPKFISFAFGYASHTISDIVGFAPQGGYLGNYMGKVYWTTKFIQMLALDSLLFQGRTSFPFRSECVAQNIVLPKNAIDQDLLEFMAVALKDYHSANSNIPLFNATQIGYCSSSWAPEVDKMNQYAQNQTQAATDSNLLFWDVLGLKTIEETQQTLNASFSCIVVVLRFYAQHALARPSQPLQNWQDTLATINSLFNNGYCIKKAPHF